MRSLALCAIGFAIGSLIVLLAGCSGSRPAYGLSALDYADSVAMAEYQAAHKQDCER